MRASLVVALCLVSALVCSAQESTTTTTTPEATTNEVGTSTAAPTTSSGSTAGPTTTSASTDTPTPTTGPTPSSGPAPPPEDDSYTDGEKFGISTAVWACLVLVWNGGCFAASQYYKRHKPADGPPPLDFFSGTY